MKKKIKVYSISGMMEYQTIVKVGRNSVKINFTGGSISNGCTQPARFSTKSLIIQNAIEASDEFSKGRIRLDRTILLNEEYTIERNQHPNTREPVAPGNNQFPAVATELLLTGKENENEDHQDDESAVPAVPAISDDTDEPSASGQTKENPSDFLEVEVSCKDIAKQYLQDHFGEKPAPLRTWEDVHKCAAKYSIKFISPTLK